LLTVRDVSRAVLFCARHDLEKQMPVFGQDLANEARLKTID
jgi:hypothetical protein